MILRPIFTASQVKLTANERFHHSDLVTDFVTVILSKTEGLGKMAPGIVKYAYDRSSQLVGVIWFSVSCRGPCLPDLGRERKITRRIKVFVLNKTIQKLVF